MDLYRDGRGSSSGMFHTQLHSARDCRHHVPYLPSGWSERAFPERVLPARWEHLHPIFSYAYLSYLLMRS
jgi:hypothetical protein